MDLKVLVSGKDAQTEEIKQVWIDLPTSPDYILEVAGIDVGRQPILILENTFGFDLPDEIWYGQLDMIARRMLDVKDAEIIRQINLIAEQWFGGSAMEALENVNDINRYETQSFTNLAIQFMNNKNGFSYVAPPMRKYVTEQYARDLEASGKFLSTDSGIFYRKAAVQEVE